mgnify:CR=1 FL=1
MLVKLDQVVVVGQVILPMAWIIYISGSELPVFITAFTLQSDYKQVR